MGIGPTTEQILHITTRAPWAEATQAGFYTSPSLITEGFIHFSAVSQVALVANFLYRVHTDLTDLVLLCVAPDKLKVEALGTPELYPHLYGPLNLSAVASALAFPPDEDGTFQLPTAISSSVTP